MVFHAMTILIEEKGARNKMTSVYDITKFIRDEGIETSKIVVEACLDVLIQHKYVRYYVNDRRYTYYGVTALGWTRWDAKVADEVEQEDVPGCCNDKNGYCTKLDKPCDGCTTSEQEVTA